MPRNRPPSPVILPAELAPPHQRQRQRQRQRHDLVERVHVRAREPLRDRVVHLHVDRPERLPQRDGQHAVADRVVEGDEDVVAICR